MEQIVGSEPIEKEVKGFFTVGDIGIGAFVGGPFVGGWMLGENFRELGNSRLARKTKIIGIILFVLFIVATYFTKTSMSFGIISSGLAVIFFNRYQKKDLTESLKSGDKKKRTKWPRVCIIFTIVLYFLAILSVMFNLWINDNLKKQEEYTKNDKQAVSLMDEGKYNEAVSLFDKNLLIDSSDLRSHSLRGIAKLNSNDISGSIDDFNFFINNKKDGFNDRLVYFYRGKAYDLEEKHFEAISDFKNALKAPISNSNVKDEVLDFLLFNLNSRLGNKQEALYYLNETIKINPDWESALLFRAQIELSSGNLKAGCEDAKNGNNTADDPTVKDALLKMKELIITECAKL